MFKKIIWLSLLLFTLPVKSAVIIQYHHVDTQSPAVTSVTPDQFAEQMQYLAEHNFNVIPLSELISALKAQQPLPKKTIAITFDDGYKSTLENAHPILKQHGFPYAVFIAIKPIKQKFRNMMDWQDLNLIASEGAEIMNHSYGHEHLIRRLKGESQTQWLARIKHSIVETEALIKQHTGQDHKVLAYPYGEYNSDITQLLKSLGYSAVGQQSGAVGAYSDLQALARFPIAGAYTRLSALKTKFTSLNMPVLKQVPMNPQLAANETQPKLTVTLDMKDINAKQVMCFITGQGAQKPHWISSDTFEVQAQTDMPAGRFRYNCTAPSTTQLGYYWFSHAWVKPKLNGQWIKE